MKVDRPTLTESQSMNTITLRELLVGHRFPGMAFVSDADQANAIEGSKCDYFSDVPVAAHSVGTSDPLDEEIILPAYSSFDEDPQYPGTPR